MSHIVPSMPRLTGDTSLRDWIPMLWSITLDTVDSLSSVVTLGTAGLLLVLAKSIIGNLLSQCKYNDDSKEGEFENLGCHGEWKFEFQYYSALEYFSLNSN